MNRRTFLRLLGLGAVAAPFVKPLGALTFQPEVSPYLTFKGIPLVYDQYCSNSRIYFVTQARVRDAYYQLLEVSGGQKEFSPALIGEPPRLNRRRRGFDLDARADGYRARVFNLRPQRVYQHSQSSLSSPYSRDDEQRFTFAQISRSDRVFWRPYGRAFSGATFDAATLTLLR